MTGYIEKSDSSAAQTRALAAALRNHHFDIYRLGFPARTAVRLFPFVPDQALAAASRIATGSVGVPRSSARDVSSEDMARWVISRYPKKKYDTIILGAPSGGVSHIGAILGAPFLTSHFLICFRDARNVDDVHSTFSTARRLAFEITAHNRDLHVVAHYDPVHDRPVLIFINHIRVKFLSLPEMYRKFIRERLAPGGALALIDCSYPWLQYRVRRNFSFQVGGLGGIPDTEYIEGSERIDEYRRSQGSVSRGGWRLKEGRYRLERMPESEWGAMPGFNDSVCEFAAEEKIPLHILSAPHPEDFSELAFELHLEASRRDGAEPRYVFADCFNQLDPLSNLKSRLLPLWLPYYCENSFRFAEKMAARAPLDARFIFTMHPSFAEPFDMVPLENWIKLFTTDSPPLLIGINPSRFPGDLSYVSDFGMEIRSFSNRRPDPVRARLSATDAADTAKRLGIGIESV